MTKELSESIQMVRNGVEELMKHLPAYVKENERVRGVRHTFRQDGEVPYTLAKVLDIMDAIEMIEKIDTPDVPFLSSVKLGNQDIIAAIFKEFDFKPF